LSEFEAVGPVLAWGVIITVNNPITSSPSSIFSRGILPSLWLCLSSLFLMLPFICFVTIKGLRILMFHLPNNLQLEDGMFFLFRLLRCSDLLSCFAFSWCSLYGAVPFLF
jgi:hypothetical protein